MLAQSHKLNSVEFKQVFEHGRTIHSPHFMVKTLPQKNHARGLQAAVVVSKKISKKAVDRNRLRRQIFAALHPHVHQGQQMVCILKSKAYAPFTPGQLQKEISHICESLST